MGRNLNMIDKANFETAIKEFRVAVDAVLLVFKVRQDVDGLDRFVSLVKTFALKEFKAIKESDKVKS